MNRFSQLQQQQQQQQQQREEDQMLWGPSYRCHLYYGTRTSTGVDALLFGIGWFQVYWNPLSILRQVQFRHVSKAEDNVAFRWEEHDGRYYGKQTLNDTKNGLILEIFYWKKDDRQWAVRIKGHMDDTKQFDQIKKFSVLSYLGIEHQQRGTLKLESEPTSQGPLNGVVHLSGDTPSTGSFSLVLIPEKSADKQQTNSSTYFSGLKLDEVWCIEQKIQLFFNKNTKRPELLNHMMDHSNTYLFQKFLTAPFQLDIVYLAHTSVGGGIGEKHQQNVAIISEALKISSNLEDHLQQASRSFNQRFDAVFPLISKQYNDSYRLFAKIAFSNLMGGIAYFYGYNRIYKQPKEKGELNYVLSEQRHELFTATPSRIYFPRGFVWDEGFHQLLISRWDQQLSQSMLTSWLNLVDKDGWLPREQILGTEAESRVPGEFIIQYPEHGNPPTFFLPLQLLIKKERLTPSELSFLESAFYKLSQNFLWWLNTQQGETPNSWRWRGANGMHTLTCGLDDYPRQENRTNFEEHVDLLCWMVFASSSLTEIATKLNLSLISIHYAKMRQILLKHLEDRHWDPSRSLYCDLDSSTSQFSGHFGYVNLFPFLFGFIPNNDTRLKSVLDLIENILWSKYGLRSLSASDKYFGKGENYWRGPIWVNVNYLVLRSLRLYYVPVAGHYQECAKLLYSRLRSNLVNNIYKVYEKQGDFYENYSSLDGHGMGQHPFAGWTSLVVLAMAELY